RNKSHRFGLRRLTDPGIAASIGRVRGARPMQIVDAQIHTWGSGLPSNQSHIQVTHFTPQEAIALMDEAGVDAAVIHPPGRDPHYASEAYPFPALHPYLRQVFDAFGPERMFWGTDITKMKCPWRQCVTMFTEELPWLRGRDLELVMGEALCQWWGWDRKASPR